MDIILITPVAKRSLSGNRATAVRWAGLLRGLGHRVRVEQSWSPARRQKAPELLVAIHAWRSAPSVAAYRAHHPAGRLVVLMAGTDIYRYQYSRPQETLACMEAADLLVGLHDRVAEDLPSRFAKKLRIIHQSAVPLATPRRASKRTLDICVVGHLREEKDPLRAAFAARTLSPQSRIRVLHLGKAHDECWARRARQEMAINARYQWRGEVPRWQVRKVLARSHAMVISSRIEGGANVVSEAVVAGVPVLASFVSGNVGLLGESFPGYFPVADTVALASLLQRAEHEEGFLPSLTASVEGRRSLFTASRERAALEALLKEPCR